MSSPRYPSDLSDEEWELLQPLLSSAERRGRPPKHVADGRLLPPALELLLAHAA